MNILMKRAHLLFLCGLLALSPGGLVAGPTRAPKDEELNRQLVPPPAPTTGEEVLRRALEARGGGAAAARIQSLRAKGTADLASSGRADYEFLATRHNRGRAVYDFGGGARIEFGCDGQAAWKTEPGSGTQAQSGDELRENLDEAAFFAWYDDPANYRSVAYVGEASFDGTRCYELKLVTQSGRELTHYYNTTNYLLAGSTQKVTIYSGPILLRTSFLEYQYVAGFWFPTRLRCSNEEAEWVVRITSLKVNCVGDAEIRMPATTETKTAAPPGTVSDAEIKRILQDRIGGDKVAVGLVVGLLDAQGSRVISCGKLDNGDSPEVNGDTLFEIGSITKLFTRLLLHDMVARGQMNLDDPVQKYLPASVRMPTRNGRQITLWDLTTHTSGLPREMGDPWTVEHLYAFLGRHQLRRDPGDKFEYSNVGMALLGHVIARRAGQDYETLVRERICRPLKMDSTAITLTPALQARRAAGHDTSCRPAGYIGLQAIPGSGAIFSTVNDMLKFASARLGLTPSPLTPLMRKTNNGHSGGTYGFSTMLSIDAKHRRALVVLANCRANDMVPKLGALLIGQSPKPLGTVPLSPEVCDPYIGQYYAPGQRIRTVRREGDRWLLQEWGNGSCELFPLSATNFYNQLFDCRANFVLDSATSKASELQVGDWRGARLAGQVLPPTVSLLTDGDCSPRVGSDLQGVWQATVRVWYWPFVALHLKVRIAEPSPGAFQAEGDCVEQGVKGEPLAVIYGRPAVKIFLPEEDGSFTGVLNSAHTQVRGVWKQAGYSIHATLRRAK